MDVWVLPRHTVLYESEVEALPEDGESNGLGQPWTGMVHGFDEFVGQEFGWT